MLNIIASYGIIMLCMILFRVICDELIPLSAELTVEILMITFGVFGGIYCLIEILIRTGVING